MEKRSVTVRLPALDSSYQFLVPDQMPVREIQLLMIRILRFEYGIQEGGGAMLFDLDDGMVLRAECSFSQLGISDGAKLLLL